MLIDTRMHADIKYIVTRMNTHATAHFRMTARVNLSDHFTDPDKKCKEVNISNSKTQTVPSKMLVSSPNSYSPVHSGTSKTMS